MFFEDHEKAIYSPQSRPDLKFDPLALDRELTKTSGGRFSSLLKRWTPIETGPDGLPVSGDISEEGRTRAALDRADAEGELVAVARKVFQLPDFPESRDAEALELLLDYLWWMEGKGQSAGTPPTSSAPSDAPPPTGP